jgi:hypothetical protein
LEVTRPITLRGAGSNQTFLDGEDDHQIIVVSSGTRSGGDPNSVVRLEDLSLRGGLADPGGALRVQRSNLVAERCVFSDSASPDRAGAVSIEATMENPQVTFIDCAFFDNLSGGRGGAVHISTGAGSESVTALFRRCAFLRNHGNQGGAVLASVGSGTSRIDARFEHCRFQENEAKDGGAVLALTGSAETHVGMEFVNCLLTNNLATGEGGAVRLRALAGTSTFDAYFAHCTITGNRAPNRPGFTAAVSASRGASGGNSTLRIVNSILWADSPSELETLGVMRMVENCIVFGGVPEPGNLDIDPRLASPEANDFRLGFLSPGIDAGSPELVPPELVVDLGGGPRVLGDGPDLGAYERE